MELAMWLVRYILIAWSVFALGFTIWAMAAQEPRGLEKLTAGLVVAAFVLNLIYLVLNRPAERG
jgi:hypothetical protein